MCYILPELYSLGIFAFDAVIVNEKFGRIMQLLSLTVLGGVNVDHSLMDCRNVRTNIKNEIGLRNYGYAYDIYNTAFSLPPFQMCYGNIVTNY